MADEQLSPEQVRREALNAILVALVADEAETYSVYFQPPSNHVMEYPCIRYRLLDEDVSYADNLSYARKRRYEVMVIDYDPDTKVPDKIANLPYCRRDRRYEADNLYHDPFVIYF